MTIFEALTFAIERHQAGQLDVAEQVYRQVLQADPNQFDALHLLGVIAAQVGQHAIAVEFIGRAVQLNPNHAESQSNLGNALKELKRLDEAVACYRRALAINPNYPDALNNLGNALLDQGRVDEAIVCYQKVLQIAPFYADAHGGLGNALKSQGKLDEAIVCLRRAMELKPNQAYVHSNLGSALNDQGKLDEAAECYRRALTLNPNFAIAHANLGSVLLQRKQLHEAIAHFRRALDLDPDNAVTLGGYGHALKELGDLDEALACFRRALELNPDFFEMLVGTASVYIAQKKTDEAAAILRRMIEVKPDSFEAHYELGTVLMDARDLDEAVVLLRRAIDLKPTLSEAHNNLGIALTAQGMLDESIASFRRAIELDPQMAMAHRNLGITSLLKGDFEVGWPEYAWRWRCKDAIPPSLDQPLWDGSPLNGKTILLWAEQGLGDTLQFVRYAPLVQQRGGRVLLQCPAPLFRLLHSAASIDQLIPVGVPLPSFDVHSPLLGLPGLLGTTSIERIPVPVPYLDPGPELIECWQSKLQSIAGFRVGIAWQGSSAHLHDHWRSVRLDRFSPLAAIPGIRLISLQVGAGSEQLHANPDMAIDLTADLTDMTETAAVVRCLDLVISVDTAVIHLAGALGVPAWVALAFAPDWRWLRDRDDSPWYPSMRLFRQERHGDWDGVFERLTAALREAVKSSGEIRGDHGTSIGANQA